MKGVGSFTKPRVQVTLYLRGLEPWGGLSSRDLEHGDDTAPAKTLPKQKQRGEKPALHPPGSASHWLNPDKSQMLWELEKQNLASSSPPGTEQSGGRVRNEFVGERSSTYTVPIACITECDV